MSWEQRRLDRQLAALAEERERLQIEQQRLQTDSTYVEGRIRSTFKVARPGEIVIPLDRSDGD
jgi:cell division protein FtsB